ncbi:hypothetical protein D9615_001119 [Tricholomella constricta]|uniref:Uncharacterized protein n=1 Tax=Tricholomella constricta TaxID=117010 RepID=A0A8H5HLC7_9AGAR|nr:hypothetical protein D9615_001119 [Tricholomella constricta]
MVGRMLTRLINSKKTRTVTLLDNVINNYTGSQYLRTAGRVLCDIWESFRQLTAASSGTYRSSISRTRQTAAKRYAKTEEAYKSNPRLMPRVKDSTTPKEKVQFVTKDGRPSMKFVDVGGHFIEVYERLRRIAESERKAKINARKAEENKAAALERRAVEDNLTVSLRCLCMPVAITTYYIRLSINILFNVCLFVGDVDVVIDGQVGVTLEAGIFLGSDVMRVIHYTLPINSRRLGLRCMQMSNACIHQRPTNIVHIHTERVG